MAGAVASTEGSFDMDKVSYEIFSILESKFLFGYEAPPSAPPPFCSGRVRILSVDAGGATDGLLAAASLALLEASLQKLSGESSSRIADFFDIAAGSGAGGILVALLFTCAADGRPLYTAAEALDFLSRNRQVFQAKGKKKGRGFAGIFRRKRASGEKLERIFGEATLRETVKPVLIPCYDLETRAPFLFSRAGAVETDGYNFLMREVCGATTAIAAVDGGVAVANPAAAAITHVLNNRMEFPSVAGAEDLLVVSLGNGESSAAPPAGRRLRRRSTTSSSEIVKIAVEATSDTVDQAVAMALERNRTANYVRIQARVGDLGGFQSSEPCKLQAAAEELLEQRNVASVLFRGKRLSDKSNAEILAWASAELVREREGRKIICPPGARRDPASARKPPPPWRSPPLGERTPTDFVPHL
ncbi:unnamed protein product [Spirodela intermedia]|uniref:Patatin n=1 Tax=Spirodela intermedia TaxID=51605 RepID=A0A7I8JID8_SPIIN|nr:unnamed protein product [Spirodela intermedia]CAA6669919.1 unnamed protein product [Spirodela intermedia]